MTITVLQGLRQKIADYELEPLSVNGTQLTYRAKDGTTFSANGSTLDEAAQLLSDGLEAAGEFAELPPKLPEPPVPADVAGGDEPVPPPEA
jgi:hypothetical protein